MSNSSFVAVSLLALSVNLPELPELWQPDFWRSPLPSFSGDRSPNPHKNTAIAAATEIVPDVEALPEFSPSRIEKTGKLAGSSLIPQSGAQLYQQRLAALNAGQLYTRLLPESFAEIWQKAIAQPTHQQWKMLLAKESKAIAGGQGSNHLNILVGDSLSMWFPPHLLPRHHFWLNQGISGENSGQIRDRLHFFAQTRPSTIYVMAGTNDLRQRKSDAVILKNISAIVQHLKQNHPQGTIVVQSILPTRNTTISNDRIRRLNRNIATIARQEGGVFLDVHSFFTDEDGELQSTLTTDGIHLSSKGYEVWRSLL